MKKFIISILALLFSSILLAQTIPVSKRVNWSGVGAPTNLPIITNTVNVMTFGAHGDSVTNDASAINSAIASLGGHAGIIKFPVGKFLIQSTLSIPDSVILRGDCSDSTWFIFKLGSAAIDDIDIQNSQNSTFRNIIAGYTKESTLISVDSTTGFSVGDYAEISETNGTWNTVPISWALDCVGQFVQITAINGNNLTIDRPLRITYNVSLSPKIRKWKPRVFVGIEDLHITRVDTGLPVAGYAMSFYNAMNCWVKGVESGNSVGAHVSIDASSNITVSGCYFHDAYAYDGTSTRGYGVLIIQHSGQNLVENNIFNHLRHSIILKQGANGNVAGYNYCINGYRSEAPFHDAGADICLHGHYSFANLLEGNLTNNIQIDSTWGPTGPYTTFYRNRSILYGITMTTGASVNSDSLNFVGNEITNSTFPYGQFILAGTNHFEYGNNQHGTIIPTNTTNLVDTSYYRTSFNDFWQQVPFPPTVGMPVVINTGSIPAKDRFNSSGRLTVSPNAPCITTNINEIRNKNFNVFPNPANNSIHVELLELENSNTIELLSSDGRIIYKTILEKGNSQMEINASNYPQGLYLLKIANDQYVNFVKMVIER